MITPVLDNLLLEPMDEPVTKSGIIRPETNEKPEIGKLISVGPKVEGKYKGNIVYKKWLANEVKVEGRTYILVAEKDVLGVING